VHAVQLEMCWHCYLQERTPHAWAGEQAATVEPLLRRLVDTLLSWRPLWRPA
jgi:N-formylglutamate deformylase